MHTSNYPSGQKILEPQANDIEFEFENEASLFSHVLEHVFASHNRERWDDLDIIPRNDLHKILKMDSIRDIINKCSTPVVRSQSPNKNRNQHNKHSESNQDAQEEYEELKTIEIVINNYRHPKEYNMLQNIPQFMDLAERYQKTLSNFLRECSYNIHPHYHILKYKKKDDGEKFMQVIKMLDAQTGILIVANAPYMFSPNSRIIFKNRNQYVIVSGYRFWRSKTQEERTKKFNRSQKELYALELNHDREYQKILDIQKHLPEESELNAVVGE
ncbi:MAG: hypothetical protein IJF84_09115 [Thermoguttaceae bacterium]|nr:hypothetical protein [Thermoguttaceae bacterium]